MHAPPDTYSPGGTAMALIAHGGPRRITALLRELMRPRVKPIAAETITDQAKPPPARKHYPPQRDRVIESAAMAREMYRL
jgi:hypothetical protein